MEKTKPVSWFMLGACCSLIFLTILTVVFPAYEGNPKKAEYSEIADRLPAYDKCIRWTEEKWDNTTDEHRDKWCSDNEAKFE